MSGTSSTPVPVYTPGVSVVVTKLVDRSGGQAKPWVRSERTVDLTRMLGDESVVRTNKSLSGQVGGFSVSFADGPVMSTVNGDGLSAYDLLEPMDYVEIRAARESWQFPVSCGPLPLLMRGFISSLRRVQEMGADGSPQNVVVIQGQDYGKLWHINQIWFDYKQLVDLAAITCLGVLADTGMDATFQPVAAFVQALVNKVMNPKVDALIGVSKAAIPKFLDPAGTVTVSQGQFSPMLGLSNPGPFWQWLEVCAERPWNELFIRDEEAGPALVFRPAPFKDLATGNLVLAELGAVDPGSVDLDDSEVVSVDMGRSDEKVANFFWCPPGPAALLTTQAMNVSTMLYASFDQSYPNSNPSLYGEKRMDVPLALAPNSLTLPPSRQAGSDQAAGTQAYITYFGQRAAQLEAMNRDNICFEEGSITTMGRETYQVGTYLRLSRFDITSSAYITGVAHTISPFQNWTTSLTLERGTGFNDRLQYGGKLKYWAEGRSGPYTPV